MKRHKRLKPSTPISLKQRRLLRQIETTLRMVRADTCGGSAHALADRFVLFSLAQLRDEVKSTIARLEKPSEEIPF